MVVQAMQVPLERTVAIKFIKHSKQTAPSATAQARVQSRWSKRWRIRLLLCCQNLCYHVSPWGPYLVSEFVEGRPAIEFRAHLQ